MSDQLQKARAVIKVKKKEMFKLIADIPPSFAQRISSNKTQGSSRAQALNSIRLSHNSSPELILFELIRLENSKFEFK